MCESERNADNTMLASSGFSKASAAVLLVPMARLSVCNCSRFDWRISSSWPSRNSKVVINNAIPQVINVMVLSLRRMGTASCGAT
jgi:hypothetical protein